MGPRKTFWVGINPTPTSKIGKGATSFNIVIFSQNFASGRRIISFFVETISEMRKLSLFMLVILFAWATSGIALGAGYNHPTSGFIPSVDNPHGGYADTTNKCKTCHAVHLAEGWPNPTPGFRLLRANSAANECDYCHGVGGHTELIIGVGTVPGEGHTMGYTGTAPDDSDSPITDQPWETDYFACPDCHSPHGNNLATIIKYDNGIPTPFPNYKLLKVDPDPYEAKYWVGIGWESEWCSDCHSANYGLHTEAKTVGGEIRYGHDVSGAGPHATAAYPCVACHDGPGIGVAKYDVSYPEDPSNKGPTCKQCHQSSGYPHSQGGITSRDMLKNAGFSGGRQLDDICNDCHFTPSLP